MVDLVLASSTKGLEIAYGVLELCDRVLTHRAGDVAFNIAIRFCRAIHKCIS